MFYSPFFVVLGGVGRDFGHIWDCRQTGCSPLPPTSCFDIISPCNSSVICSDKKQNRYVVYLGNCTGETIDLFWMLFSRGRLLLLTGVILPIAQREGSSFYNTINTQITSTCSIWVMQTHIPAAFVQPVQYLAGWNLKISAASCTFLLLFFLTCVRRARLCIVDVSMHV